MSGSSLPIMITQSGDESDMTMNESPAPGSALASAGTSRVTPSAPTGSHTGAAGAFGGAAFMSPTLTSVLLVSPALPAGFASVLPPPSSFLHPTTAKEHTSTAPMSFMGKPPG